MLLLLQLWLVMKKNLPALQKSVLRTWMTMLPKQHITWHTPFLLTQAILAIAFLKLLRRRMKQLRLLLLWEAAKSLVAAPVSSVEQTEHKQAVSVLTCTKAISRGRIITMKQRLLAWTIMCHSLN